MFSRSGLQAPTQVSCTWSSWIVVSPPRLDVGGGSVPNATRHSLARIPLRWMIRQCFATHSGIQFESAKLYEIGLDPQTLYPKVMKRPLVQPLQLDDVNDALRDLKATNLGAPPQSDSSSMISECTKPSSEEEEELRDALSPLYDQLSRQKWWWILEFFFGWSRQRDDQGTARWKALVTRLPFLSSLSMPSLM